MTQEIEIRNASVYLPAEVIGKYFQDIHSVVVLIDDNCVLLLPVRQAAAGGFLLKVINSIGDCVVSAPDVFEANNMLDFNESKLTGKWSTKRCALKIHY